MVMVLDMVSSYPHGLVTVPPHYRGVVPRHSALPSFWMVSIFSFPR